MSALDLQNPTALEEAVMCASLTEWAISQGVIELYLIPFIIC